MDGLNSFNQQYEALFAEVLYMDAQQNNLTGAAHSQLVAKKKRTLDEMVQLCAAHGRSDYQRQCERVRTLHVARFRNSVAEGSAGITTNSVGTVRSCGAGNNTNCGFDGNVNNEMKKEGSGRNRLVNVEAETLDQVNDKKVSEKSCQLDRVFVKLERMTTLRGEDSNKYPRQSSVIITVSECKANAGGGNRTKLQSAEQKRREATLVVIRSTGRSMIRDGTLRSALSAAVEKLSTCNEERTGSGDEILQ
jgi:hypothetical protein